MTKLIDRQNKTNDEYHKVIDDLLSSGGVVVGHKSEIGSLSRGIFDLMHGLNVFLDNL